MKKWIIVIAIAAIAFIGTQATAFAEDETEEPELVGISFEPTSPLEFEPLALVHGSYRTEGGGHIEMGMEEEVENKYFHYDCCRFSEGDCLTLKSR